MNYLQLQKLELTITVLLKLQKLIDKAKQAGFSAVKFQTYITDDLVSKYWISKLSKKK